MWNKEVKKFAKFFWSVPIGFVDYPIIEIKLSITY